VSFNIVYFSCQ